MYAKYILQDQQFAFSEDENGGIEISKERHAALLEGQSQGKRIVAGVDGFPVLTSPPAPTLGEMKSSKWNEIKSERDRRQLDGGVKVGDHWFLSTERATSEYNTTVITTQGLLGTTVVRAGWRTMDGAEVDMTPMLALQILSAGISQRCAIDDAAQSHKTAMEASADPSSYDFSGGWPVAFGI